MIADIELVEKKLSRILDGKFAPVRITLKGEMWTIQWGAGILPPKRQAGSLKDLLGEALHAWGFRPTTAEIQEILTVDQSAWMAIYAPELQGGGEHCARRGAADGSDGGPYASVSQHLAELVEQPENRAPKFRGSKYASGEVKPERF